MAFGFFIPTVLLFSLVTFQISSAATCEAGGPQTAQDMPTRSNTNMNIFLDLKFTCPGKVTQWIFYAKSKKIFTAEAWRETSDGLNLNLIGKNKINVTALGEQTYDVPANEQFQVQANDIIGVGYLTRGDNIGVVPYNTSYPPYTDGVTPADFGEFVDRNPLDSNIGRMVGIQPKWYHRTVALRVVVAETETCEAGGPQTALAMDTSMGTNGNIYYDTHFDCAGTVTKWIFYAKNAKIFFADAWRETDDGKLTLIGSNQISVTTVGYQTYDVPANEQFEVQANDMIGVHYLERGDNKVVVPWDDERYQPWTEGVISTDFSDVVMINPGALPIGKKVDNDPDSTKRRSFALRVVVTYLKP